MLMSQLSSLLMVDGAVRASVEVALFAGAMAGADPSSAVTGAVGVQPVRKTLKLKSGYA